MRSGYLGFFCNVFFIVKLEIGDPEFLKCGVYRIIGSGAKVQSVLRCFLAVKMVIPLFHDGMRKLQRWNHLTSERNSSCLLRKKRFLCGPDFSRLTEGDTFRYVGDNLADAQLKAADGPGAVMIVKTIRLSVGPKFNSGRCLVAVGLLPT